MKIAFEGTPFTLNGERKINEFKRAELVREWKGVAMLARQPKYLQALELMTPPFGVEVNAWCRVKADRGAYFPAAKAMIDALIGIWWADDTPEWIAWERHWAPVVTKLPVGLVRVELTVVCA